ncbi:MAG: preprotein translocase subunit YajC [Rikenellaceae bacterium]|nr:preprotein translocase subunit YajC [Rikenellaceae bacterium]
MMNLLQAAAPQGQSSLSFLFMIGLMILVMWLFMWRPESKRRKELQKFRDGLKKGDKVVTAGGIYATVKEIHETTLLIEVDSNVTLRVDKNMVVADPTK